MEKSFYRQFIVDLDLETITSESNFQTLALIFHHKQQCTAYPNYQNYLQKSKNN